MRLARLWRNLAHKSCVERDLDEEARAYLELLVDEKMRNGATPAAARRQAMVEMGGIEQVKERVREVRSGAWIDAFWRDLRYGGRVLWKNPGMTGAALLVLALGIGANTAIFSLVYGVLYRPLPFPGADRVVVIFDRFAPQNAERGNLCAADYFEWRAQAHAFQETGVFTNNRFDVIAPEGSDQLPGASVSSGFFRVLGIAPIAGRAILPEEDAPNGTPVVVLGEALWKRSFGARNEVIGESVLINGVSSTIVGVMPDSFRFPRTETALWVNLRLAAPARRGPFFLRGIGRLRPGVTLDQAQAEANAIGHRIEQANPRTYTRLTMPVIPLRDAIVGDAGTALKVLFGAVSFVLVIAAVNVASLLLARAGARQREMAVRSSLGAGRIRIIRQLLTECILLSAGGGVAGLALAAWAIRAVRVMNPGNLPRVQDVQLDERVLAFTCAISLLAGIAAGLAPAWQASRASLTDTLNDGGRSGTQGTGRRRTLAALVIVETALSLVLLTGAGLLLRSLARLQEVPTGLESPPQKVLTMRISINPTQYADSRRRDDLFHRLLDRAREIPGVEAVALGDSLPPNRSTNDDTFVIEHQLLAQGQTNPSIQDTRVTPDYFRTLGIPLRTGRLFTEADRDDSPQVALISESMALRFFPGEDPIGRRIKESGPDLTDIPYRQIVGIVGDVKYNGLDRDTSAAYYLPAWQDGFGNVGYLTVRTSYAAASLSESIRRELQGMDPQMVISQMETMERATSNSVAQPRFRTALIGAFAGLALLLAAIGLYGVIAYSVSQRTQEIGVRIALGAGTGEVLRMVIREGAVLAVAGIGLGLAGSVALTRLLDKLLFGVTATDPLTFLGVSLLMSGVSLAAILFPARRATRIDPLIALRWE